MQQPNTSTSIPVANPAGRSQGLLTHVIPWVLMLLVIALVGGNLYGIQWAAQRGISMGYPTPHVQATYPQTSLMVRQAYNFTANATGRDLTYLWDFGDGTQGTTQSVQHAFQGVGDFTVTVKVVDPLNQSSTTTFSVHVIPPAPVASFVVNSQYYGSVYFDASQSAADSSTQLAQYSWNFGDGSTDPNGYSSESHYYYSTGTFTVTLVVTDQTGQSSQPFSLTVVVQ